MSACEIKFSSKRNEKREYDLELWINGQFNSSWSAPLNFIDHADLQKFAKMVNRGVSAGKEDARKEIRGALGIQS
jgi:hypothetical protein